MADFALRAAAASGVDVVARQVLQFLVIAVLARLLAPADFGVVALATVVVVVLGAVADVGIRISIVRMPRLDDRTIASAYWVVGILGTVLAVVAAVATPLIDRIPSFAGVGPVLPALAPVIVLNAVAGVSTGVLWRGLRLWTLAAMGIVSTLVSGAAALAVALRVDGPTALVVMALVSAGTNALWATLACRPRVWLRPRLADVRGFMQFGRYLVGTTLLDTVTTRLPLVAVSSGYGVAAAGQYSRADGLALTFKELTDGLVGRAALPLLAGSVDDDASFVAGMRTGYRLGTAVVAPLVLLVAALATPLVVIVYGPQWVPAGPLVTALLAGTVAWPVNVVAINALLARGLSRSVFLLDLRNKTILVVLALGGLLLGPLTVASGVALAQTVSAVLNMRAVARAVHYPVSTQLRDTVPIVVVSVPWAVLAWVASTTWELSALVTTPSLLVVGTLGIMVTARLTGVEVIDEVLARLRAGLRPESR